MRLLQIDTWDIVPSPHNPRRLREGDPAVASLAESIKQSGILQPLVARATGGTWELLAGHRRLAAAKLAGLEEVPVLEREATDREAMEIVVTENMQREDLTPLEEARGVHALLMDGMTHAEAGQRLGRTANWVARRAALLNLDRGIAELAEDPKSPVSLYTVAMLEELARLPAETQGRLAKELNVYGCPATEGALLESIERELRRLGSAPWPVDDDTLLPKAGSCSACPKRLGAQPDLFADQGAGSATGADHCLDGKCWGRKLAALALRREAELRAEHPGLVLVHGKQSHDTDRLDRQALDEWSYEKAKKTDPDASPALVIDGSGAGKIIYIKTERSGGAEAKPKMAELSPAEQLAERELALQRRRSALCIERFLAKLDDVLWSEMNLYEIDLIRLASAVGTGIVMRGNLQAALYGIGDHGPESLWDAIRDVIIREMNVRDGDHALKLMETIEQINTVLPTSHMAQEAWDEAEVEIPEPKALAALRKQVEASKPAKPAKKAKAKKGGAK